MPKKLRGDQSESRVNIEQGLGGQITCRHRQH
jgi:hypothetical protein